MKRPRYKPTPSWSVARRRRVRVLARDGGLCRVWGPGCTRHGTDVARVGDGENDDGYVAICRTCLSARAPAERDRDEAELAMARLRRRRPHPGER